MPKSRICLTRRQISSKTSNNSCRNLPPMRAHRQLHVKLLVESCLKTRRCSATSVNRYTETVRLLRCTRHLRETKRSSLPWAILHQPRVQIKTISVNVLLRGRQQPQAAPQWQIFLMLELPLVELHRAQATIPARYVITRVCLK
jgi:hypothetical protein